MKYVHALNHALNEILQMVPEVYLLGEDLLDPYGGAFKVTAGLSTLYPDRVLATPLSEHAITGMAGGMALRGLIPIVEIMFGDFLTLGMDQILNHITKYHSMYGGAVRVPVIIRTPMGGGRGYGPTHSQSLEKYFLGVPGLSVVAPSRYHQPGALLKQAVELGSPVLFVEHKLLYPLDIHLPNHDPQSLHVSWEGNEQFPDALVRNYADGSPDVVILTYGGGSVFIEELLLNMRQEEIKILCYLPSLINQVRFDGIKPFLKDAVCIVMEEGTAGFGWGAEMLARLAEEVGPDLGAVRRIATLPTVIPVNQALEKYAIPGVAHLRDAILGLLQQKFK